MTPEEAVERGVAARAIIDNPLFVEAWEQVDRVFYEAWRNSDWRDQEAMVALKRTQSVAAQFRAQFERMIGEGKYAEDMIRNMMTPDTT